MLHGTLYLALEGYVRRYCRLKVLQLHLVLLLQYVTAGALDLVNDHVDVAGKPPSASLLHVYIEGFHAGRWRVIDKLSLELASGHPEYLVQLLI